jgi:hypothetical protein
VFAADGVPAQSGAGDPGGSQMQWLFTVLISVVTLFLAVVAGALLQMMFFLIRDARDNLKEVRHTKDALQQQLELAGQRLAELRSVSSELRRERVFLAARRRGGYDLYSCWSSELARDASRAKDLTQGLMRIGHLFESCAVADEDTPVRAIAGLGGELNGVFDAPVRDFLEALERGNYYPDKSAACAQLLRLLGQGARETAAPPAAALDTQPVGPGE